MAEPRPPVDAGRSVRAELRAWLDANWDPTSRLVDVARPRLADAGWARPSWPTPWCGRGLPAAWATDVVDRASSRAGGAVGRARRASACSSPRRRCSSTAPTSSSARFLRPTLTGELTWCQLFSEPGAGSDLAGPHHPRRRATATSGSSTARRCGPPRRAPCRLGLLLARTDSDVPKHAGITCFVLPMRQAGVEVRPLRQMNGHASFNEVFLDDAPCPAGHVVGEVTAAGRSR